MKAKRTIGIIFLLLAGLLKWLQYDDHHSGAWLAGMFDPEINFLFALFSIIGLALIVWSILQFYYERESPD
jgi:hypothetical protein